MRRGTPPYQIKKNELNMGPEKGLWNWLMNFAMAVSLSVYHVHKYIIAHDLPHSEVQLRRKEKQYELNVLFAWV